MSARVPSEVFLCDFYTDLSKERKSYWDCPRVATRIPPDFSGRKAAMQYMQETLQENVWETSARICGEIWVGIPGGSPSVISECISKSAEEIQGIFVKISTGFPDKIPRGFPWEMLMDSCRKLVRIPLDSAIIPLMPKIPREEFLDEFRQALKEESSNFWRNLWRNLWTNCRWKSWKKFKWTLWSRVSQNRKNCWNVKY